MWADNLETEMVIIRELVEDYPYVAMVKEQQANRSACPGLKKSPCRMICRTRAGGRQAPPRRTFVAGLLYHNQEGLKYLPISKEALHKAVPKPHHTALVFLLVGERSPWSSRRCCHHSQNYVRLLP